PDLRRPPPHRPAAGRLRLARLGRRRPAGAGEAGGGPDADRLYGAAARGRRRPPDDRGMAERAPRHGPGRPLLRGGDGGGGDGGGVTPGVVVGGRQRGPSAGAGSPPRPRAGPGTPRRVPGRRDG